MPRKSSKPKTSKEDVEKELKTIYQEPDGEMPDLTQLSTQDGSKLRRILLWIIGIALPIAAIVWGGFFVWSKGIFTTTERLQVAIEGPAEALSGEEVYYTIRYENDGRVPLANLDMKLNLPTGFKVLSTLPTPTENSSWVFGSLSPGSDGAVTVKGIFLSEVPSTRTLQAFFTYKPANFSSEFQKLSTHSVTINESVLTLEATGPEKALAGDAVSYTINLKNTAETPLENVHLKGLLPEHFVITTSTPELTGEDTADWTFPILEPGELKAVTIEGQYTASAEGNQSFGVRAVFVGENNVELTQTEATTLTDIVGGALAFDLIANGRNDRTTINPGETLRVSLNYANDGNEQIEGTAFTLTLSSEDEAPLPVNWESATLAGAKRQGNTLTWNTSTTPDLAAIPPKTKGTIDISIPIKTSVSLRDADSFEIKVTAETQKVGSIESPRTIDSTPISVAINSDLSTSTEARYFDEEGTPVGSGPLPPKVGETTLYRVYWNLENTLHALHDVRFSTNLPPDVRWTNQTRSDIGSITFDETTRIVTWSIDKLPADIESISGSFDVAITPNANDVGAFFKLTNATSVEATDSKTQASLTRSLDILTTELPTDTEAAGKGVVLE